MDWIEVTLRVDGEAAEAVAELLQRYGHQGVVIEQDDIPPETWDDGEALPPQHLTIRAYFPADERAETARLQIETGLSYLNMLYPMPSPAYAVVHEADWAEAWKAHYHPVRVGRRLYIRPVWDAGDAEAGQISIALDPGMAFGTGTHPTTQLCLEALEDRVGPGSKVLDLGCGSGILAIAAARLGAASVLALDTDSVAIESAQQNIAYNGLTGVVTAQQGSLESVITSARRFDLIVVNILARTIIAMCAQRLGDVVRPGGTGLFSGIIHDQAADVETALRQTGLRPIGQRQQGDWVLIEARRPGSDD